MSITNGYATIEELQDALDPAGNASWSVMELNIMEIAIEAASRWIDGETGTRFYLNDTAETRYYTAEAPDLLHVDDLQAVTTLKVDTNGDGTYNETWDAADYRPGPRNAALKGQPYREIRPTTVWRKAFPSWHDGVEITGTFGYSATAPAGIHQACLLIAQRLYKRRDAIFGVGNLPQGAAGVVVVQAKIQQDADILLLLSSVASRSWV